MKSCEIFIPLKQGELNQFFSPDDATLIETLQRPSSAQDSFFIEATLTTLWIVRISFPNLFSWKSTDLCLSNKGPSWEQLMQL